MDGEAAVHLGGVTFGTFVADMFVIFMFALWIWLLISVFSDLFRRHDISGGAKVIWATKAREEMRNIVGFSAADEIRKLDELKAKGSITDAEYQKLRARLI